MHGSGSFSTGCVSLLRRYCATVSHWVVFAAAMTAVDARSGGSCCAALGAWFPRTPCFLYYLASTRCCGESVV
ncbi:hypothetical protein BKA63DRAFT_515607, partial [Paraphoma chrysanthemicola]